MKVKMDGSGCRKIKCEAGEKPNKAGKERENPPSGEQRES